jgi:hypothetical protein
MSPWRGGHGLTSQPAGILLNERTQFEENKSLEKRKAVEVETQRLIIRCVIPA